MAYLPTIAWSTLASNVTLGPTAYRYYITVNYLNPNEPGSVDQSMTIGDYFIDFAGYPFIIEGIDGNEILLYDLLERGDGVSSAYGPYADKLGYIYRPLNGAIILTQAQLRKLDMSASDIINPIEKGIIWAHDFWEKDENNNIYQLNIGDVIVQNALRVDTIHENTLDHGVDIETVHLEDGTITARRLTLSESAVVDRHTLFTYNV